MKQVVKMFTISLILVLSSMSIVSAETNIILVINGIFEGGSTLDLADAKNIELVQ